LCTTRASTTNYAENIIIVDGIIILKKCGAIAGKTKI
jgi:hypothetical protein